MLEQGASHTVRGTRLWVRFGSAGNLTVILDGRWLRVPTGTYDAIFDARGFSQISG